MEWKQIIPAVILAVFAVTLGIMLTGYFTLPEIPSCTVYCNSSSCVSTEAANPNSVICLGRDIAVVGNIIISADNVTLNCQNYLIDGNDAAYGIYSVEFNGLTIANCEIINASKLVYVRNSYGSNIFNNILHDSSFYVDNTGATNEYGIDLSNLTDSSIINNTIYNIEGVKASAGINSNLLNNVVIDGNTIYNVINGEGLTIAVNNSNVSVISNEIYNINGLYAYGAVIYANNSNISFNKIYNSANGLGIYQSINTTIEENEIYNCTEFDWGVGLELWDTQDVILRNNNITENNYGIFTDTVTVTKLYNSNISNNAEEGIYLYMAEDEIEWIIDDEANLLNNPAQVTNINVTNGGVFTAENSDLNNTNLTVDDGKFYFMGATHEISGKTLITSENSLEHSEYTMRDSILKINKSVFGGTDFAIIGFSKIIITNSTISALNPLAPYDIGFSKNIQFAEDSILNNSIIEDYKSFTVHGNRANILNNLFYPSELAGIGLGLNGVNIYVTNNTIFGPVNTGISLAGGSSNAVLHENNIFDAVIGIGLSAAGDNNTLSGNYIQNATAQGIYIGRSVTNSMFKDNVINQSDVGIQLEGQEKIPIGWLIPTKNTIQNNTILNAVSTSIYLIRANNNTIKDNIEIGGAYGLVLDYSWYNNISSNSFDSIAPISLIDSSYNRIEDHDLSCIDYCIYLGTSLGASLDNQILNNNISNGEYGILMESSVQDIISGCTVTNNNYGLYLVSASDIWIEDTNFSANNLYDFVSESGSTDTIAKDITFGNTKTSFEAKDVAIFETSAPDDDLIGYSNISKYLDITTSSLDSWIYLNISYDESDIPAGFSEYTLKLLKHNGTEWIIPGDWAFPNSVNADENYVYAQIISMGSVYAPMAAETCECVNQSDCEAKLADPGLCPGGINITEDVVAPPGMLFGPVDNTAIICGDGIAIIGDGTAPFYDGVWTNAILQNCIIRNFTHGLILTDSWFNTISDNIFESVGQGINLVSSSENIFSKNTIFADDWAFSSETDSIKNTVTEMTIAETNVSFDAKDVSILSSQIQPVVPEGYSAISHFLEITNNSADSWIEFDVYYTNADVSIQNFLESTLKMWKYNDTWTLLEDSEANTEDNIVSSGTITEFSIFAPLGEIRAPSVPSTGTGATPTRQEFTCAGKVANYYFNILNAFETKMLEDGFCNDLRLESIQTNKEVLGTEVRIRETTFWQESPETTYKYFEIYSTQISKENLEKLMLELRVSKDWVSGNRIDVSTIELYKYADEWIALGAEQTYTDESYYYFTAETEEFSVFTVSGEPVIKDDFWHVFEVIQGYYMNEISFEDVVAAINTFYRNA